MSPEQIRLWISAHPPQTIAMAMLFRVMPRIPVPDLPCFSFPSCNIRVNHETVACRLNNLSQTRAILLGQAQDAGVPQLGCDCANCQAIAAPAGWPVSLALVDDAARQFWIIDATPEFQHQYRRLASQLGYDYELAGILLTHAHIGHYTGLMHLGKEAMSARNVPVYCTAAMEGFLSANAPWSQLVELGNIAIKTLTPGRAEQLSTRLAVTPVAVPHRGEYSDTVAFLAAGSQRRLFYCPDIDYWPPELDLSSLSKADYALLDGSFFSPAELPGRDLSKIPHPLVTQTVEFVKNAVFSSWIIHLNHSNPLWREGNELQWLHEKGLKVAEFGEIWEL